MADDAFRDSEILVESYAATSPQVVALAQLASPACRIEPQLLRRLRLACLPSADVSVEQELWQSDMVNSRGKTITLREGAAHVLRRQLRVRRATEGAVIETARRVMAEVHAGLSPLLMLEDELAWAEVFDDAASLRHGAQTLLASLLARRDGLDYWLGRAWSVLPADLKTLPQGRELAQVAAARGAEVSQAADAPPAVSSVGHLLPLAPVTLKLEGLALSVNVRPSEATHVLDAPQTQPRALSVTSPGGSEQVVFGVGETKTVQIAPGTVIVRTVTGTEYELQASSTGSATTTIDIELLPAGHSTSVLIEYVEGTRTRRILVDCGDRRTGRLLVERLQRLPPADRSIDLLVLTHIDDGRIGGAIPLLEAEVVYGQLRDVWFNGYDEIARGRNAS